MTKLALGYIVFDGLGWLSATQIEVRGEVSICIERNNGSNISVNQCNLTIILKDTDYLAWQSQLTCVVHIPLLGNEYGHAEPVTGHTFLITGELANAPVKTLFYTTPNTTLTTPPTNWDVVKSKPRVTRTTLVALLIFYTFPLIGKF